MSPALALALAIIVLGGIVILSRLELLVMAVSFWLVFVAVVAVVAATGHSLTARWHLGPVAGLDLWTVLAFSPEILVFLFFMLTDPKTVPTGRPGRAAFAVSVALLAALLVAYAPTEFWAKVGVLAALAFVCAARAVAASIPSLVRRWREDARGARRRRARRVRRRPGVSRPADPGRCADAGACQRRWPGYRRS